MTFTLCFPGSSGAKASACSEGDLGSIPGSGRSPGEGNDKITPLTIFHGSTIEDYAILKWFFPTVFNNSKMKKQSKNWITHAHRYIKSSTLYMYETIKEILSNYYG